MVSYRVQSILYQRSELSNSRDGVQYGMISVLRLIYLIFYFFFQVSSHKSDIAVIVFPLARVTFKYS
jgi:hypothetical protein